MDSLLKYAINSNPIVKQINEGFDSVCNKFEKKDIPENGNVDDGVPRKSLEMDESTRLAYEQQKKLKEQAAVERNIKRAGIRSNIREKYGLQQNERDKELLDPNFSKDRKLSHSFFRPSIRSDDINTSLPSFDTKLDKVNINSNIKATTFKEKVKKLFKIT